MKTNWKEIDRMSRMSPKKFGKLQGQDYGALAAKTQKASDDYSKQYLRNVNPPVTKPKQPTPFESYASYFYETTGKNATQKDFDKFMADVRAREDIKRRTAPPPTVEGYDAWARRKASMEASMKESTNLPPPKFADLRQQMIFEQAVARGRQQGLSPETIERALRAGESFFIT